MVVERRPAHGRRQWRRCDDQVADGHGARGRGQLDPRSAYAQPGRSGLLRSLLGRGPRDAAERRRGQCPPRRHDALLARMAGAGPAPGPPLARPDPALGPGGQGSDVHADRGDGGRVDDLAARDPGRRAQLGLPLHLDARFHVHAPGAPLPQPRLGGRRVHAVRRRSGGERRRWAPDHVRDRRAARPHRVHARRTLRLRRSPSGARGERGVRPAPERCLRRRARLHPAAHAAQRAIAAAVVADRPDPGRVCHGGLAQPGPGDLGGPGRATALRVVEADVLGRPGSCVQAGPHPRRPEAARELVQHRR